MLRRYLALAVLALAGCGVTHTETVTLPPTTTQGPPGQVVQSNEAALEVQTVEVKLLKHEQIQELIASHKGKVVVMDCWSLSCDPCVKEFPNLVALHKKHGPEKVACVSLSFDYEGLGKPEDVLPTVQDFLEEKGATFDNVLCADDSETLYKKMSLASVPAVYVYKKNGELAKRFDNENAAKPEDAFNYEHVAKLVEQLVAEGE